MLNLKSLHFIQLIDRDFFCPVVGPANITEKLNNFFFKSKWIKKFTPRSQRTDKKNIR